MKVIKKNLIFLLAVILIFSTIVTGKVYADDDPKPTKITKLNYSKRTVKKGNDFEIKAYTKPWDCDDDYLVWTIKNQDIVKFEDSDHTGDDMDFVALKKGTTTITCTIQGTNISKSCTVTVKNKKKKAKIVVDDTHMDVDKGEWDDIEARLTGGSYKNRKLTYKVHNKKIIKVKRGKVYGKRVGRTKITIRAKANKKIKKVVYVRVENDD
ncbi:MAG: Ig-like domain-containing protein [Anaerostipes sp.]|nr:Ig-like domain-containing protein [Anaerostipes sp.]